MIQVQHQLGDFIKLSKIYEKLDFGLIILIEKKIYEFRHYFGVNPDKILVPINKKDILLKEGKLRLRDCLITANFKTPLATFTETGQEITLPDTDIYIHKLFGIEVYYVNEEKLTLVRWQDQKSWDI